MGILDEITSPPIIAQKVNQQEGESQSNTSQIETPIICGILSFFAWILYLASFVAFILVANLFKVCKYPSTYQCNSDSALIVSEFGLAMGAASFISVFIFGLLLSGLAHIIGSLNEIKINFRSKM
jgi:hypothetical protein